MGPLQKSQSSGAAIKTSSRYYRIVDELETAGFTPEPAVFDETSGLGHGHADLSLGGRIPPVVSGETYDERPLSAETQPRQ